MDISTVFRSKTRKELFRLFFTNPESEFYLRELERKLGIPVSMIRGELMRLNHDGVFNIHRRGNLLFYRLNKTYPFFNELKSIVSKTIGTQGLLTEILKKIPGIETAFIYGSFARQEENAKSDIDLLVVGNIDENSFLAQINRAEKLLKREINYSVYTPKEFKKQRVIKNGFLNLALKQKVILLRGRIDV
jgi:predicted nucleotidyltransferase